MAKLFERLFGQANKKDEPYQPMPVTAPRVFCRRIFTKWS